MAILKGFPPMGSGYYLFGPRPPEMKIKVEVRDPICRKTGEYEEKEFAHLRKKTLVAGNGTK